MESLGYDTSQIDDDNLMEILTKNNFIQTGPSELVYNTIKELISEAHAVNDKEYLLTLFKLIYDLTGDNQILGIINTLEDSIDNW